MMLILTALDTDNEKLKWSFLKYTWEKMVAAQKSWQLFCQSLLGSTISGPICNPLASRAHRNPDLAAQANLDWWCNCKHTHAHTHTQTHTHTHRHAHACTHSPTWARMHTLMHALTHTCILSILLALSNNFCMTNTQTEWSRHLNQRQLR